MQLRQWLRGWTRKVVQDKRSGESKRDREKYLCRTFNRLPDCSTFSNADQSTQFSSCNITNFKISKGHRSQIALHAHSLATKRHGYPRTFALLVCQSGSVAPLIPDMSLAEIETCYLSVLQSKRSALPSTQRRGLGSHNPQCLYRRESSQGG